MNRQMSTHDEALRKKFSGHRFVLSPVGICKLLGIVLFLIAAIISVVSGECSSETKWLALVFPICNASGSVILVILYASSILGLAKRIPDTWAKIDIASCIIIAVIMLVMAILLLASCSNTNVLSIISGVFGILGSLLLVITAATFFITWRNIDDEILELPPPRIAPEDKRKSVFI